ncbi:hypothetical protein QTP70_001607 [Hemibagrus guttatus]|uniref:Uncharacterized protein n=1 Tax=Hemibagrus guttatus TaxID=175788 RepID=A0AAE0QED0_9TELE|nr:hypothetical protein QTP70_001607 [Hemibagrus guttatus]
MPPGRLPGEVFRACPTGKKPWGKPRTSWRDYVSRLAWKHLGVPPEELEEVSGERERTTNFLLSSRGLQTSCFRPEDYKLPAVVQRTTNFLLSSKGLQTSCFRPEDYNFLLLSRGLQTSCFRPEDYNFLLLSRGLQTSCF